MKRSRPNEAKAKAGGKQTTGRVLLAEGDVVLSDMYRTALEDDGWSVEVVHDGPSALDRALESPPDVFLMNTVPGLEPRDLLERIRDHPPTRGLAVILLANSGDDPSLQLVEDLEVLAVVVKSRSSRQDLSKTIRRLLESRGRAAEESGQAS